MKNLDNSVCIYVKDIVGHNIGIVPQDASYLSLKTMEFLKRNIPVVIDFKDMEICTASFMGEFTSQLLEFCQKDLNKMICIHNMNEITRMIFNLCYNFAVKCRDENYKRIVEQVLVNNVKEISE